MRTGGPSRLMSGKTISASVLVLGGVFVAALAGGAVWMQSRRAATIPTIALIPQTAGAMLWDVEHFGAAVAAERLKCHLYWNAPTSETDVAGQISLIDKVVRGKYQGLVLAPNHPLAILTSLKRVLAADVPVVIVSAPLDLVANGKLGFIVNDDQKMGEIAAAEIARILHGKGNIALAGLARYAPGVKPRVLGAESFLASRFPDIHIVSRLGSAYYPSRTEDLTNGALDSHPELNAILSFTAASTRGVHTALKNRGLLRTIPLVGCEQDSDLIDYLDKGEIAAILAENTYQMGYAAIEFVTASLAGNPLPARSVIAPLLITSQNLKSAEVRLFTGFPR